MSKEESYFGLFSSSEQDRSLQDRLFVNVIDLKVLKKLNLGEPIKNVGFVEAVIVLNTPYRWFRKKASFHVTGMHLKATGVVVTGVENDVVYQDWDKLVNRNYSNHGDDVKEVLPKLFPTGIRKSYWRYFTRKLRKDELEMYNIMHYLVMDYEYPID